MVVGGDQELHNHIIQLFHDSALGGHSGVTMTTKRIHQLFFWKGLHRDVRNFIRACRTCQQYKSDVSASGGLL